MISVIDSTIVLLLEPLHSLFFADSMLSTNSALASSPEPDSAPWPLEHNIEIHSENTGERVILDSQIDVLLDAEAKAASIRKVPLSELSVLDLEASL